MNQENYETLEFTLIREKLAEHALSQEGKKKARTLQPFLEERICKNGLEETTQGKRIVEIVGNPPLSSLEDLHEILTLAKAESMLHPEHFVKLERFLTSCSQMSTFLKRGATLSQEIGAYGEYIQPLKELRKEIQKTVRHGQVDDSASSELHTIRRRLEKATASIHSQLERLLAKNPSWFAESFIANRSGRFVLAVKRQHRSKVSGSAVEVSGSGATVFVEPSSVQKIHGEIAMLELEQENEIIRILYTLTNKVVEEINSIETNKHYFEVLDFLFAKAKLSLAMDGMEAEISSTREIIIREGRHPLLDPKTCVPLNMELSHPMYGIVITGPNTGGKTVALKTVGLLSLMVQSGLHVPVAEGSRFPLRNLVLCDIGDGQSITNNLSTFSAHITKVIRILQLANRDSLVLLDELGSGTDPGEGMGLAVAITQELVARECLFVTTTHYPEVKEFASKTAHITNARMAFNRETLTPLYQLEVGEAGESCALYIAQQLGLPSSLLEAAHTTTYGSFQSYQGGKKATPQLRAPKIITLAREEEKAAGKKEGQIFQLGDSVLVGAEEKKGIVYKPNDNVGMVGVLVGEERIQMNQTRLKLLVAAKELYPEDYDFSILFDSVANRKARNRMGKRHEKGLEIIL